MAQQTISKMETVQTAVDWLENELHNFIHPEHGKDFLPILEQAKQMEKEQIINAMLEEHMFDDSEYANRRYKYWQEVKQKL